MAEREQLAGAVSTGETVLYSALLAAAVLHPFVAAALFHKRKRLFPIVGRSVINALTLPMAHSVRTWTDLVNALLGGALPCEIMLILFWSMTVIVIVSLYVRCFRLWFIYRSARTKNVVLSSLERSTVKDLPLDVTTTSISRHSAPASPKSRTGGQLQPREASKPLEVELAVAQKVVAPNQLGSTPCAESAKNLVLDMDPHTKHSVNDNDDMESIASTDDGAIGRAVWFADRRHWVADTPLFAFTMVVSALLLAGPVVAFVVRSADDSVDNTAPRCETLDVAQNVISGIGGCSALVAFFVVLKLYTVRDAYGIKKELFLMGVIALVAVLLTNAIRPRTSRLVGTVLFAVLHHALIVLSVTHPLWRSYKENRPVVMTASRLSSGPRLSLEEVFADAELFEMFVEHMRQEFAVENILFHRACKDFAQKCGANLFKSSREKNLAAGILYVEYVMDGAINQVNLDYPSAQPIKDAMGELLDEKLTNSLVQYVRKRVAHDERKELTSRMKHSNTIKVEESQLEVGSNRVATLYEQLVATAEFKTDEAVPCTFFEDAKLSVYHLMELDSVPRFRLGLLKKQEREQAKKLEESTSGSLRRASAWVSRSFRRSGQTAAAPRSRAKSTPAIRHGATGAGAGSTNKLNTSPSTSSFV